MNTRLLLMIIISFASLALIVPLFTDSSVLLPTWMLEDPYPTVFLIIWFFIIVGGFIQVMR